MNNNQSIQQVKEDQLTENRQENLYDDVLENRRRPELDLEKASMSATQAKTFMNIYREINSFIRTIP